MEEGLYYFSHPMVVKAMMHLPPPPDTHTPRLAERGWTRRRGKGFPQEADFVWVRGVRGSV